MSIDSQDDVSHAPDNNTLLSEVLDSSHMATPHEQPTTEPETVPSIERPTREFLEKNYLKSDLQKRCRELGITNIWTNKSQLIEMILKKTESATNDTLLHPAASVATLTTSTPGDTSTQEDSTEPEGTDLLHLAREIKMIKSKLATKDMEIELLSTEVKAAYNTIEQLQHRVMELEKHRESSEHHSAAERPAPSDTCLLLGDSNLSAILRSDLHHNCRVRTIPGANLDLLRSWVNEKLQKSPSECIIYCGTADILEKHSSAAIFDNLGALISDMKEKNSTMTVHVCQVVPYSTHQEIQERIEGFNDDLVKWAETNGIPVINTAPTFTLGTGDIDDLCFDKETNSCATLNRLGAIKLLSTINKQCPQFKLCPNWEAVRRNTCAGQSSELRSRGQGSTGRPAPPTPAPRGATPAAHHPVSFTHSYDSSISPHHPHTSSRNIASHRSSVVPEATLHRSQAGAARREQAVDGSTAGGVRGPHTYAAALRRETEERRHMSRGLSLNHSSVWRGRYWDDSQRNNPPASQYREQEHYSYGDDSQRYQSDGHTGARRKWSENSRIEGYKVGCYNCGEYNHVQSNCRFDHKLKCGICRRLGHKSRLCQYYSP